MNEEQEKRSPLELVPPQEGGQHITLPFQRASVVMDGVVFEVFVTKTFSFRLVLEENDINTLIAQWKASRKQLAAQQQLVRDAMRNKNRQ